MATEFSERIHLYAEPPASFDPLTASEQALEKYGLPTRPASGLPVALEFWTTLLSRPLRFVRPSFQKLPQPESTTFAEFDREAVGPGPRHFFSNRRRFDSSRNWSGLYLRAKSPDRFVSLAAAWVVPEPGIPAVAPVNPWPGDPNRDEYRSSIWVGLNGYRSYPHVTMPQIGTWQRARLIGSQKVTDIAAWWQWWSRDEVTPIVKFENLPVRIGDTMLAALVVVSSDEVIFYIKNQSTGDLAWLLVQAPPKSEPLGTTAEWIVERPTTPGHIWPWRMPKLTDIVFSRCHAFSAPRIIGPRSLHRLEQARFIRMKERFESPYRSAIISVPDRTDATTARVRYQEG